MPAVQSHQFLHQSQPDAAALMERLRPFGDAVKAFEEAGSSAGGDSDAAIRAREVRPPATDAMRTAIPPLKVA